MSAIENRDHVAETECCLVIAAEGDVVPQAFLREVVCPGHLFCLAYDDLGYTWDFGFHNGILRIFTDDRVLRPISIYHRHPGVSQNHPFFCKHVAFFETLDHWKGNLLGQRSIHFHNASKPYQCISSLMTAKRKLKSGVKFPKSFICKGAFERLRPRMGKELIVKSCSNTRSIVVDEAVFSLWNAKNLHNLPVLFQETISGKDIRIHLCADKFWELEIVGKDATDYRYASKGVIKYKKARVPAFVRAFVRVVSQEEKNALVGVDFLLCNKTFYCLEVNPGPGWSTFRHKSKKFFAQHVMNKLLMKGEEEQ